MTRWAADYLAIPYLAGGRSEAGCDCWGLVRLVHQRQRGVLLPLHAEIQGEDLRAVARAMMEGSAGAAASPWQRAEYPARHDVVLMSGSARGAGGGRIPVHCGVMVDDRLMLHIERDCDAVVVPLDDPTVARRIMGVFRHVAW